MAVKLDVGSGNIVRTIRLYGVLGARFGRVHHLAVSSAAEAVRALGSQLPGFEEFLHKSKDMGFGYAIFYGKRNLSQEELRSPCGDEDIRIAPIIFGSKNGGWLQIILGVVLIVIGAILNFTPFAGLSPFFYQAGIALIIGGVVQLLTPQPKGNSSQDRPENRPGYSFNGPLNTQAQGHPVPVLYGELIVGSAVISAGINVVDQAYIPYNGPRSGYGGGGGGGATNYHQL